MGPSRRRETASYKYLVRREGHLVPSSLVFHSDVARRFLACASANQQTTARRLCGIRVSTWAQTVNQRPEGAPFLSNCSPQAVLIHASQTATGDKAENHSRNVSQSTWIWRFDWWHLRIPQSGERRKMYTNIETSWHCAQWHSNTADGRPAWRLLLDSNTFY